jgi:hypothetical protein
MFTIYVIVAILILVVCGVLRALDSDLLESRDAFTALLVAVVWPAILSILLVMSPFLLTYWLVKTLKG